jgi:predicted pyridoxine 5'-phosphate oxidase superfamily flavin-nucleotide-binding protein
MVPDGFYTEAQRAMQAEQDHLKLADTVRNAIVWDVVEGPNAAFIESRDFFFLATVDGQGRPTVSYKGGAPGVVKVLDPKTLIFPIYDGNGMYLSAGNAAETGQVGLLFIDMETPNRVRVQGQASVSRDAADLARYPGARMVLRVAVTHFFLNCARYIHKHRRIEASPYVPDNAGQQPHPAWKRIDFVQDALPDDDRQRTAEAGGTIDMDGYVQRLMDGTS